MIVIYESIVLTQNNLVEQLTGLVTLSWAQIFQKTLPEKQISDMNHSTITALGIVDNHKSNLWPNCQSDA